MPQLVLILYSDWTFYSHNGIHGQFHEPEIGLSSSSDYDPKRILSCMMGTDISDYLTPCTFILFSVPTGNPSTTSVCPLSLRLIPLSPRPLPEMSTNLPLTNNHLSLNSSEGPKTEPNDDSPTPTVSNCLCLFDRRSIGEVMEVHSGCVNRDATPTVRQVSSRIWNRRNRSGPFECFWSNDPVRDLKE